MKVRVSAFDEFDNSVPEMKEFNNALVKYMEDKADELSEEYSFYIPTLEVGADGIIDYYLAGPFEG